MDINKQEQMQNWKKAMIMDPLLNNLFTDQLLIKDFLHQKILTQDHERIVQIYSKLSSIKHALSKQIQKQVETKHSLIQKSFLSKHQVSTQLKIQNLSEIQKMVKNIQSFNASYVHVKENVTKLDNINKIIRFSKGLEKFKINCRLLKTFMKDYNPAQKDQQPHNNNSSSRSLPSVTSTSNNESLNLTKVSKLLKELNDLMSKHDFSGIKYYENQKHFINSSKDVLFSLTEKQLTKTLTKYLELITEDINIKNNSKEKSLCEKMKNLQEDIKEKLKILNSINKLKQFIPAYCKKILITTSDILKSLFETYSLESFEEYFASNVFVTVLSNAKLLLRLEEILTVSMLSKNLTNANLPNLFEKYIERLVSYFTNLINWNLDQDIKEAEKRKVGSKSAQGLSHVTSELAEISENKNPKLKTLLVYKYPILFSGLSSMVNKIHEFVLLQGDYNKGQYEFYVKKSQIMNTMLPISKKFHQKFEELISFDREKEYEVQKERIRLLRWFYNHLVGISERQCAQLSVLIESLNDKLLGVITGLVKPNEVRDEQIEQRKDLQQSQNSIVTELLTLIDRREAFKHYSQLESVVKHMKIIKHIKNLLDHQKEDPLPSNHTDS